MRLPPRPTHTTAQLARIQRLNNSLFRHPVEPAREDRPVVLIACSKAKLETGELVRAGELYLGDLFLKAKAYAQAIGADWFILSAKHGVMRPDRLTFRYDDTLADMTPAKRAFWAREVAFQLKGMKHRRLIVLAGEQYCQWVDGFNVERPLQGLAIGKQKQRLLQLIEQARQPRAA